MTRKSGDISYGILQATYSPWPKKSLQFSRDSATELLRKFGEFLALNELIPKTSLKERSIHKKARKYEINTSRAFAWLPLPLVVASPLLKKEGKL